MRILTKDFWLGRTVRYDEPSSLTVTIVIPAWNEEESIAATIKSVLAQDYPIKCIVVNDRSTDQTSEIAHSFADVQVIDLTDKAGSKSQALNKALPYLDTDLFICVDADTILEPDAVGLLIRAFNDPKVMVACGFVNSIDRKNFWQGARYAEYHIGQRIVKAAQANANMILVASGCFMAIRSHFIKDHPFDERTMAEDLDLTWSAVAAGHNVAFVSKAICHVHDPYNYHTYTHQVRRWYRGYFQNIKVRNWRRGWRLGTMVYGYLIVNLLSLPITLYSLWYGYQHSESTVVRGLAIWFVLLWGLTLAMTRLNPITFTRDFVRMMVLAYGNYLLYLQSFVQEIVLRRELKIWVKGH